MRQLIIALLFLLANKDVAAQKNDIDSLLKVVETTSADTILQKAYRKLGDLYVDNNPGKAISYYEKGYTHAKAANKKVAAANFLFSIGYAWRIRGEFDKSLDNYLQSIRIYEELKDTFRLGNALLSVGNVYQQAKNTAKMDEYYTRAQTLGEAYGDSVQISSIYTERGIQSDVLKQYDTAISYFNKALKLVNGEQDPFAIANLYSNIGLSWKHKNNTTEALRWFDSAQKIYENKDVPPDYYASLYNNFAATYAQSGNYARAKEFFDKSIGYAIQGGARYIEMENYRNLADMYDAAKDYRSENEYLKKYYNLKDSMFTADSKNQLTELEADYHLEQKNGVIIAQKAEVEKQRNQRNLFIILAIAAALVLSALVIFYSRIKKKNQLLEEKNREINRQRDELEKLNHVKDRLFSIISHDLRNPLVTLRSYLSLTDTPNISDERKQEFKTQTLQAVAQTSDMLDNLLAWANMQIKDSAVPIRPVDLTDCVLDVEHNVNAQAMQKQISIHKQLEDIAAPGDHNIISIALRNLLTNAIKYSPEGKNIYISVEKKGNHIEIAVKDEGIGMSPEQIDSIQNNQSGSTKGTQGEKGSGMGIFLVKELLEKIRGQLMITSEPGKGSTFMIQLPTL